MRVINTPAELDALPDGAQIEDGDYLAIKRNGAWFYPRFNTYWEPKMFPLTVIGELPKGRTP